MKQIQGKSTGTDPLLQVTDLIGDVLGGKKIKTAPGANPVVDLVETLLEDKPREWLEKTVDAFLIHSQVPAVGSVLYCNLCLIAEHTGIYVGDGKVVHLNGNGQIEAVDFRSFMERLEGRNPTISIFCPTDSHGRTIGNKEAAQRALSMVGSRRHYDLLLDNCHCFTYYCLTGKRLDIGSFTVLEELLRKKYDFLRWRAINIFK